MWTSTKPAKVCKACKLSGWTWFFGILSQGFLQAFPASPSAQLPFSMFQLASPGPQRVGVLGPGRLLKRKRSPHLPSPGLPVASLHWRPPFSRLPSGQSDPLHRWQEGHPAVQTTAFFAWPPSVSCGCAIVPDPRALPCCCPSPCQLSTWSV